MSDIPERAYQDAAEAWRTYPLDCYPPAATEWVPATQRFRAAVESAYRAGVASQQAVVVAARAAAGPLRLIQALGQDLTSGSAELVAAVDALDGQDG